MISIVVLTYNRYQLLRQTIQSILDQTYPNFEIVIINDGSTDETSKLKSAFTDNRIKLFNLEKNNSLAKLRNYGIQKASGEIIAFCDDDDLWVSNKLEIQIKLLDKYSFVCSNSNLIDIDNKMLTEKYLNYDSSFIIKTKHLLLDNMVLLPSVIFKKSILKTDSPFDESKFTNLCEDYNLWLKLSINTEMYFYSEPLIQHRLHNSWARKIDHSQQIYINHICLIKPFTKSDDIEIREAAHESILNNRIYQLKNLFNYKKYYQAFIVCIRILFMIITPVYLKPFYAKCKLYFKNKLEIGNKSFIN